MYSYNSAGAVTKKRLRIVRTNGTVDKDVLYSYGTDGKLATVQYPGVSIPFSYYYDAMDRPIRMSGPSAYYAGQTIDHAKDVVYGVAGQVTSMSYLQSEYDNGSSSEPRYFAETKTYNAMFQLTRQTTTWSGGTAADVSYTFADSNSNGRITARKNWYSGEEVLYQYDSLNRVISASVSGSGGWGQSFAYDGFGNLLGQTVTKGTAPSVSLSVQMATNRISTYGYDNNGNTTSMLALGGGTATIAYDVSNRMISWDGPAGVETYRYLGDNKRVWKRAPNGAETVYFYGTGGGKLMTYSVTGAPFALNVVSWNVYFAGKTIRADGSAVVYDRLGSVMARSEIAGGGVSRFDYFPYGGEMGAGSAENRDKFGTYSRDQTTGLDYADQRYFASLSGRFTSSNPYEPSGGVSEPGSWNRYSYVSGDPVNFKDPRGLLAVHPEDFEFEGDLAWLNSGLPSLSGDSGDWPS